jgi:predicted transposase YdaD
MMEMIQTLPPQYERRAKSTYEQIREEFLHQGEQKGLQQGLQQGIELLVRNVIANRPALSDQEIAELLGVEIHFVQKVRQSLRSDKQ